MRNFLAGKISVFREFVKVYTYNIPRNKLVLSTGRRIDNARFRHHQSVCQDNTKFQKGIVCLQKGAEKQLRQCFIITNNFSRALVDASGPSNVNYYNNTLG